MGKYSSLINTICIQLSPDLTKKFLAMMGHYMAYENQNREQEKVLNIIKEKLVNIVDLWQCTDLYTYNSLVKGTTANGISRELTQEEFELLKRWLECQKN